MVCEQSKMARFVYWNNQELIAEELDLVAKLDLSLFVSDTAGLMLPKTVALEDARPHKGGSNTGAGEDILTLVEM